MLITFILKIIWLLHLILKEFRANDNKIVKVVNKTYEIFKNFSKFKNSKNKTSENLIYI